MQASNLRGSSLQEQQVDGPQHVTPICDRFQMEDTALEILEKYQDFLLERKKISLCLISDVNFDIEYGIGTTVNNFIE